MILEAVKKRFNATRAHMQSSICRIMVRLILRRIRGCCSGAQSDALLHAGS
jgi:hypothetical protein